MTHINIMTKFGKQVFGIHSVHIAMIPFTWNYSGAENFENQLRYGRKTFAELEEINRNGFYFSGIHHKVDVISCCDWKAAACIEGNYNNITNVTSYRCSQTSNNLCLVFGSGSDFSSTCAIFHCMSVFRSKFTFS